MPMQSLLLLAELKALGVCPCRIVTFGCTGGIGCVPMQNFLFLAEPGALGVCPCRIYCFWQNWGHWACAHAEFIAFGRTEGIGRVPMQNLLLLAELKALGVCPCGNHQRGTRSRGRGGAWGRRERRDGRCARRGVATSSPAWLGRLYPVRAVESAPGIQTPDTRHLSVYIMHRLSLKYP